MEETFWTAYKIMKKLNINGVGKPKFKTTTKISAFTRSD